MDSSMSLCNPLPAQSEYLQMQILQFQALTICMYIYPPIGFLSFPFLNVLKNYYSSLSLLGLSLPISLSVSLSLSLSFSLSFSLSLFLSLSLFFMLFLSFSFYFPFFMTLCLMLLLLDFFFLLFRFFPGRSRLLSDRTLIGCVRSKIGRNYVDKVLCCFH